MKSETRRVPFTFDGRTSRGTEGFWEWNAEEQGGRSACASPDGSGGGGGNGDDDGRNNERDTTCAYRTSAWTSLRAASPRVQAASGSFAAARGLTSSSCRRVSPPPDRSTVVTCADVLRLARTPTRHAGVHGRGETIGDPDARPDGSRTVFRRKRTVYARNFPRYHAINSR